AEQQQALGLDRRVVRGGGAVQRDDADRRDDNHDERPDCEAGNDPSADGPVHLILLGPVVAAATPNVRSSAAWSMTRIPSSVIPRRSGCVSPLCSGRTCAASMWTISCAASARMPKRRGAAITMKRLRSVTA